MKRILVSSLLLISILTHIPSANSDTANPPKIIGVKILDAKSSYAPGDEIIYDITFSGGYPGIKSVQLYPSPEVSSGCIGRGVGLQWVLGETYSNSSIGLVGNNVIRLAGTISSDCIEGLNKFQSTSWIQLVDRTDLTVFTYVPIPAINVVNGKFSPPGTLLAEPKTTAIDLDFLQDSYVVDELNPTLIELPKKNSDGIVIAYTARSWIGPQACKLMTDSSGYGSTLVLMRGGECNVEAGISLTRSEFSKAYALKSLLISTKAEEEAKAKKEAAAKAEKELQERKAAEATALNLLNLYTAMVATLEKNKIQISTWITKYPKTIDSNPDFKVRLMRALDYKVVLNPTQTDVNNISTLLVGDNNEVGLNSTMLQLEVLIAKQINLDAAAAKAAAKSKTTITCIKGKLSKKVTAVKPVCPKGYKKK